ncbi:MAG: hypothetical protein PHY47_15530 [Lachnospiraceae bacterium]|nr:hypothetical protein [Lachnospiraceae bacterium]
MVIIFVCLYGFSNSLYENFWQIVILEGGSMNYNSFLGELSSNGIIYRLGLYSISFLILFSLIALIPNRDGIFAKLGSRSMQVYILHIGAIYIYNHFVIERLTEIKTSHIALSLLFGVLITFLFSSKFLENVFNILLNKKLKIEIGIDSKKP